MGIDDANLEKTGTSANRGNIQTDGQDKIVEETLKQSLGSQMSSEQNEKDLIVKNPQSVETKKLLPRVKSELNPKMNKSENYATMADDPYFEEKEEIYNDRKTVDRAMTVYGEPD